MSKNNKQSQEAHYDATDITVLEGLEAVRKRPGMYIGSTGPRGLHHLVYEIVDNSVDEALAGYATQIDVTLNNDGSVTVCDNGRGIPVDEIESEGKSAVEVVLTQLHAGGKFGGKGYAVSGGLHGVGLSVVNALANSLHVDVKRAGYHWTQDYKYGIPQAPLKKGEPFDEAKESTGTTITFVPNGDIMEVTVFDYNTLRNRFQQMAFLNKGLKITLTDNRDLVNNDMTFDDDVEGAEGVVRADDIADSSEKAKKEADEKNTIDGKQRHKTVAFQYKDGIKDYVHYINKTKRSEVINKDIVYFEAESDSSEGDLIMSVEIAMQWTTAYSETLYTFANTISTTEGGTHEEGFKTALTSLLNKYARSRGLLKEKDSNLTGDDAREGLSSVISIKISEPQFEGQTKTKLGNTEAKNFVQKVVNDKFGDWLEENPNIAKNIIKKALSASQARMAARKAREATRRKSVFESGGMPDKLKDCQSKDPSVSELFIVEGDSAGGSAIQGRDPETQAILPLRGKILNVEKARIDRAMASDTIQSLITALGTGTGDDFNPDKARYHKIILMSDADVDGAHIATLLLTFLFRYMPDLISLGYVYLAQPPLYRIKWSNAKHEFVFSDEEQAKAIEEGLKAGKKLPNDGVQRYKGLGEMSFDELRDTTMDPEHRILKQVTLDDEQSADETFSVLMGDNVELRRKFIQNNAKDVRFLDI